jgi:membrane-associated phospholipid phosphatase
MRNLPARASAALLAICLAAPPAALPAQSDSSPRPPASFRWYHGLATLGVVAAASALDRTVNDEVQRHRTAGKDDVARALRRMGEPVIYAPIALGTIAVGLISGKPAITRAGGRITGSLLTAGAISSGLKLVFGRHRPSRTTDPFQFSPFSGDAAFPSGHTTMAFALAASVSDELHSTPASIGLYTLASGTAWSRVNDNKHWLSDVLAGAAVGITTAKFIGGRWRVFGVNGPRFLLEPGVVGVSLQF